MPRLPDTITFSEITNALDTLADVMVGDRTDELAGHNASFWRDVALVLREVADEDRRRQMSLQEKVTNLVSYVHSLTDFVIVETVDGDYNHMGATITDAILQAGINYETTVRPRVQRLLEQYPEARTTSGFLNLLADVGPTELLEWKGEKPERVLGVTRFFVEEDIETEAGLREWLQVPSNSVRLKQLRGISDKTADYFKILVGISTSAVDIHLYAFLEAAGIDVSGYEEAQQVINETADLMDLDRRCFDHSIWKYMSARKAKPCSD